MCMNSNHYYFQTLDKGKEWGEGEDYYSMESICFTTWHWIWMRTNVNKISEHVMKFPKATLPHLLTRFEAPETTSWAHTKSGYKCKTFWNKLLAAGQVHFSSETLFFAICWLQIEIARVRTQNTIVRTLLICKIEQFYISIGLGKANEQWKMVISQLRKSYGNERPNQSSGTLTGNSQNWHGVKSILSSVTTPFLSNDLTANWKQVGKQNKEIVSVNFYIAQIIILHI